MPKKALFALSSILLLAGCSGGETPAETSSIPSSSDVSTSSSVDSSSSSSEAQEDLLEEFRALSKKDNYSIYIQDYGGNFTEVFLPDAFYYKFDDETSFTGYLTDEGGVYSFNVSTSEVVSFDYHVYDEYTDSIITDIYVAMYSLRDCTFLAENYEKQADGSYLVKDLSIQDAEALYMTCGFEVESSYTGMSLSDLDSMSLVRDEDGNPALAFAFGADTGRGTTICSVFNVDTSVLHPLVQEALDSGMTSKTRIPENDEFFTYLANLKNMRNYTLEITSNYTDESWGGNFTTTTKYTEDSYYSVSSRSEDEDLGFTVVDGVVHTLSYNEITGTYITGGVYSSSSVSSFTSILDIVYSFADTSWNPKSFETRMVDGRYFIENEAYIRVLVQLVNDSYFAFMLQGSYLEKEGDDYLFTLQFLQIGSLTMRVTDIGTTTII